MAVTQDARYRMHQRLEAVLGDEPAATLMEHLPPTGWADLATKQDLATGLDSLDQKFTAALALGCESIRTEVATARGDMFKFLIVQFVGFFAVNVALFGFAAQVLHRA